MDILTYGQRTPEIEIGAGDDLFFTDDPVEIESSVNDTFDHLLRQSASIRLLTRRFLGDLFCPNCTDAVVNIFRGAECVFAGFLEPRTYSQGYNEALDELELNCVDALSALQYSNYRGVGGAGVDFDAVKAGAAIVPFSGIVSGTLGTVAASLDISGSQTSRYWFDGSKALTDAEADRHAIFAQLGINELLFIGDDEDDTWQRDTVLEEILRYLNLHICQRGFDFYIFPWETLQCITPIVWKDICTGDALMTERSAIGLTPENVYGTDASISIGEVYNQLRLKCDVQSVESLVESPLDSDNLASPFSGRQLYMREYSAEGDGATARASFYSQIHRDDTNGYDAARMTDWFIQVMDNKGWRFPEEGSGPDVIDKYCTEGKNQQTLPNLFPTKQAAAIFKLGSVRADTDPKDNSPVSKLDMKPYMVFSVNGNGKDTEAEAFPTPAELQRTAPRAVYTGPASGGVFSPADDETTNYIVLTGEIILNPLMEFTGSYKRLVGISDPAEYINFWASEAKFVPCRNNADGRCYTQRYFKGETPSSRITTDTDTVRGLVPFTGDGPEEYEFKYSAIGDSADHISKVAVLACMLIIGDKCVVEKGADGNSTDYQWQTYKERSQCADDDEYYSQCFTIGFDPKIGDKLIGTEFKIQNNVNFRMGIDVEGTAIPIRRSDKVSGRVRFVILGPVNTMWDEVTRRHRTWFRRTKWSTNAVPLLAHVSNIFLRSFEVKVYSDNGHVSVDGGSDLIYISDTDESYMNRKDDLGFKICSALTAAECRELEFDNAVMLCTPINLTDGTGVTAIYDYARQATAKPERLYVDSYYNEYHKPRVELVQQVRDHAGAPDIFGHYKHPALDKEFYIYGIGRNLMEGWAELKMKEVWQ